MDCDGDRCTVDLSVGRRRFLYGSASAGSLAVSGCTALPSSSDEDVGDTEATDANDESPSDDRGVALFDAALEDLPVTAYDFNPFVDVRPDSSRGVFAQWTQYLVGADRFHPHLVQSWRHSEGQLNMDLAEGFTWSNTGEPITADNLAFQLEVYEVAEHAATRFVHDVSVSGDFKLSISYPTDLNPDLVEYTLLPLLADIPPIPGRAKTGGTTRVLLRLRHLMHLVLSLSPN
ncbi:hypothetical protein [Salinarchaeum sp. Harcht-Bsk1]|uniref:hypothetical protein n=1 Tax=Salinarchaeum sp. Harcht-Bsk1 TaxID=1333523 RepID=UPI00165180FD|nr:hypothetical protein [Salinarchaeum sp. Harcht-Bsk1]